MRWKTNIGLRIVFSLTVFMLLMVKEGMAQMDFSGPIKCYYCFGAATNSSCADPVNPREDRGKTLHVIQCEHGICLKWIYYWNNQLYMHRTCSAKLESFNIMMIDGVCRSERTGDGQLCMCGRHLCNHGNKLQSVPVCFVLTSLTSILLILHRLMVTHR